MNDVFAAVDDVAEPRLAWLHGEQFFVAAGIQLRRSGGVLGQCGAQRGQDGFQFAGQFLANGAMRQVLAEFGCFQIRQVAKQEWRQPVFMHASLHATPPSCFRTSVARRLTAKWSIFPTYPVLCPVTALISS